MGSDPLKPLEWFDVPVHMNDKSDRGMSRGDLANYLAV